jgi:hypothetical protein
LRFHLGHERAKQCQENCFSSSQPPQQQDENEREKKGPVASSTRRVLNLCFGCSLVVHREAAETKATRLPSAEDEKVAKNDLIIDAANKRFLNTNECSNIKNAEMIFSSSIKNARRSGEEARNILHEDFPSPKAISDESGPEKENRKRDAET